MHPEATLQHLDFMRSDHRPILVDTEPPDPGIQRPPSRKFEAKWMHEENFREVVEQAWESASSASAVGGVVARLEQMHKALHDWDSGFLKRPKKRLRKAQQELEKAMNGPMTDDNAAKAKEMADLVEILLEQEELHWLQRARANWLMHGDQNTSFFHQFASARRKRNMIKKLKGDNDQWVEGTAMLKPYILEYFSSLFTSEVFVTDPAVLDKIQPKVSPEMNEKLLAPFTAEEVKKAAFSIGDFKAPGPDGLHAVFYKNFWHLCGEEITNEVLQAMNTGVIPEGWNDTTIFLIPKVDNPELKRVTNAGFSELGLEGNHCSWSLGKFSFFTAQGKQMERLMN
ncbi:uncharacterized protein [Lolium perenne]|uniref:uncharacterized protein n=1 Tax=Lolium perenne TaxID=4522 RepID=UPI003A9A1EDF